MPVSFAQIGVGSTWSRPQLATLWGYAGSEAISRGVVTPKEDNKIILFVTDQKQETAEQYENELVAGRVLLWEGPTDHFAEDRIINASRSGDEVHLFYRDRHHSDFTYCGQLSLYCCERLTDQPSRFVFRIRQADSQAA